APAGGRGLLPRRRQDFGGRAGSGTTGRIDGPRQLPAADSARAVSGRALHLAGQCDGSGRRTRRIFARAAGDPAGFLTPLTAFAIDSRGGMTIDPSWISGS